MTDCPSCGSQELIEDVRLVEALGSAAREVAATVYRQPGALLFKGAVARPLHAQVCASCGHTSLYVNDPRGLLGAPDLRTDEVTKAPPASEPDAGEDACL